MPHKKIEPRKDIAARLKKAREVAGYASAEDFCIKNKLSLDQYLNYENGNVAIKVSQLSNYCRLLGVALRSILLG